MMDDAPKGFKRGKDGVLRWAATPFDRTSYLEPNEAIKTCHAGKERFGCNERVMLNFHSHPCGKAAKYDLDANGNPTKCGHHSLAAKARKKAKRAAAFEAETKRFKERQKSADMAKEAQEIIRKIAQGHNDPRSLCLDWVARRDEVE